MLILNLETIYFLKLCPISCRHSKNTAIFLKHIHFIDKIKLMFYHQLGNSTTHLTLSIHGHTMWTLNVCFMRIPFHSFMRRVSETPWPKLHLMYWFTPTLAQFNPFDKHFISQSLSLKMRRADFLLYMQRFITSYICAYFSKFYSTSDKTTTVFYVLQNTRAHLEELKVS